jgi:hypothetical protein
MKTSRRFFLAQSLAMLAAPRALAATGHLVLLGDSIFDNGRYTKGGPDVIAQVKSALPPGWKASLRAVDGATTLGIDAQLAQLPRDASHLVVSIGGNDALGAEPLLCAKAGTVAQALTLLSGPVREFEAAYRKAIAACMKHDLPLAICTIYNGNFPDPAYQQQISTALTAFNDVIIRVASEHALPVLDLRQICSRAEDYANEIEPSSVGGGKIAKAIVRTVVEPDSKRRGAWVVGMAG